MATQNDQLLEYMLGLSNLDPTGSALKSALASAGAQGSGAGSSGSAPNQQMTGTVAFAYNGNTYLASMASGGLLDPRMRLASLPAFAGVFHSGGVVPGPLGAERTAIVKAGERISPAGSGVDARLIGQLNDTLCQLVHETRANTSAVASNTRSVSSVVYSPRLSSDSVVNYAAGS